jgi:hypothetical protein
MLAFLLDNKIVLLMSYVSVYIMGRVATDVALPIAALWAYLHAKHMWYTLQYEDSSLSGLNMSSSSTTSSPPPSGSKPTVSSESRTSSVSV